MSKKGKINSIVTLLIALLIAIGLWFLESWIVMLVLNWLITSFGCAFAFTFWQVFAIIFIIDIISLAFKSTRKSIK